MYTQQSSSSSPMDLCLYIGNKQVPLAPFCLQDIFFINMSSISPMYVIHKNHMSTSYAHFSELSLHYDVHGNLASHYLAILFCWINFFFFFKIFCMHFYRLVLWDSYLLKLQVHTSVLWMPSCLKSMFPSVRNDQKSISIRLLKII